MKSCVSDRKAFEIWNAMLGNIILFSISSCDNWCLHWNASIPLITKLHTKCWNWLGVALVWCKYSLVWCLNIKCLLYMIILLNFNLVWSSHVLYHLSVFLHSVENEFHLEDAFLFLLFSFSFPWTSSAPVSPWRIWMICLAKINASMIIWFCNHSFSERPGFRERVLELRTKEFSSPKLHVIWKIFCNILPLYRLRNLQRICSSILHPKLVYNSISCIV